MLSQVGKEGKRLRPTILLLMASALTSIVPSSAFLLVDERPASTHVTEARRRQQRIAEITEMIHVASLLHDDVIDAASTRRGLRALNIAFGNKVRTAHKSGGLPSLRHLLLFRPMSRSAKHVLDCMAFEKAVCQVCGRLGSEDSLYAKRSVLGSRVRRPGTQVAILAGDFLLARASVSLAALRDTEVIELLSQVIEHLVSGEILQVCCAHRCPRPNLQSYARSGLLSQVRLSGVDFGNPLSGSYSARRCLHCPDATL